MGNRCRFPGRRLVIDARVVLDCLFHINAALESGGDSLDYGPRRLMRREIQLKQPLLDWLRRTGRIREDTIILWELSWQGRRIDLATLTRSGRLTAYELKLNGSKRAFLQASYNSASFDRSYVVTASRPVERNMAAAREATIGIILISKSDNPQLIAPCGMQAPNPLLRNRLLRKIRSRVSTHV